MRQNPTLTAVVALTVILCAERASCDEVRKTPLALYALGGTADYLSTRNLPPFYDRSPAGPIAGPILSSLAFAGADTLLQSNGHHGWAKVLRVAYVVGITVVVLRNRSFRP